MTRLAAACLAAAIATAACGPGRARNVPDRGMKSRVAASRFVRSGPAAGSIADLRAAVDAAAARATSRPDDAEAAIESAAALLRLGRVTAHGALARRAEAVARRVLARDPDSHLARRHLAAALAAQHRFVEAIGEAERCIAIQPGDAWSFGVIADSSIELGDYSRGFEAVETMLARRPDAAAYARASLVKQLHGDLDGAIRLMQMAAESADPADVEMSSWHAAQLGGLLLDAGRRRDARRELARSLHMFPGYPDGLRGLARALALDGRVDDAIALVVAVLQVAATPGDHALAADLLARAGRGEEADRHLKLAEAGWRSDASDPVQLTHLLIGRDRAAEAVAIAETASTTRKDIFSLDALGWAYFSTGDLEAAARVYARLRATGLMPRAVGERAQRVAAALGRVSGGAR